MAPIVNPYLRKKPTAAAPNRPVAAVKASIKPATRVMPQPTSQGKNLVQTLKRPALPPPPSAPSRVAVAPLDTVNKTPAALSSTTTTPRSVSTTTTSTKKRPLTLKQQLKRDIQNLKRAKLLEQQKREIKKLEQKRAKEEKKKQQEMQQRLQQQQEEKRRAELLTLQKQQQMQQQQKQQEMQRVQQQHQYLQVQQQQQYPYALHNAYTPSVPRAPLYPLPVTPSSHSMTTTTASNTLAAPHATVPTTTTPVPPPPSVTLATPQSGSTMTAHPPPTTISQQVTPSPPLHRLTAPTTNDNHTTSSASIGDAATLVGLGMVRDEKGGDAGLTTTTIAPSSTTVPERLASTQTQPKVADSIENNMSSSSQQAIAAAKVKDEEVTVTTTVPQQGVSTMTTTLQAAAKVLPPSLPFQQTPFHYSAAPWNLPPPSQPLHPALWQHPIPVGGLYPLPVAPPPGIGCGATSYPCAPTPTTVVRPPSVPRTKPTPKPALPPVLHPQPLTSPSPYAATHFIFSKDIVICKQAATDSFGVNVKVETHSVLVEPELLEKMTTTSDNTKKKELTDSTTPSTTNIKEPSVTTEPTNQKTSMEPTERTTEPTTTTPSFTTTPVTAPVSSSVHAAAHGNSLQPPTTTATPVVARPPPVACTTSAPLALSLSNPTMSNNAAHENSLQPPTATRVAPIPPPVASVPSATSQAITMKKPRRKRRRRVAYSVLVVVDAHKQNARPLTNRIPLLPGDVILEINGRPTAGLTFPQACALFQSVAETTANGICASLKIARKKAVVLPSPALSRPLPSSRGAGVAYARGDFSLAERSALVEGMMRCVTHPLRALGFSLKTALEMECLKAPSALAGRDLTAILTQYKQNVLRMEQSMKQAAVDHWREQFQLEKAAGNNETVLLELQKYEYLSDAKRSALRALPRPARGCKCGSQSHEYVHDPACVLYHNLKQLRPAGSAAEEELPTAQKKKKIKKADLNAVEAAYTERILKMKEAQESEEKEARFVEEMEQLQVEQLKMAVFAPSLTVMVLSAVAQVSKGADEEDESKENRIMITAQPAPEVKAPEATSVSNPDIDDDEDDDDMPLVALGKRDNASASTSTPTNTKPSSVDDSVSHSLPFDCGFLAKLLHYISQTWGHLFHEPSNQEYAWRWEVHHGQTSGGARPDLGTHAKNPRKPDSRSFEFIRYAVTKSAIRRLCLASQASRSDPATQELVEDRALVTHLVSTRRTGLYDELQSLIASGVLYRTRRGTAALTSDWYAKVDMLLLDNMQHHWSTQLDPKNKHCVHERIRDELEDFWTRVEGGWALAEDESDLVFLEDEWLEWYGNFQEKHESHENEADGVGEFGI